MPSPGPDLGMSDILSDTYLRPFPFLKKESHTLFREFEMEYTAWARASATSDSADPKALVRSLLGNSHV